MTPSIKISNARWLQHLLLDAGVAYFAKKLAGFQRKRVRVEVILKEGMRKRQKCRGSAHRKSRYSYLIDLDASLKPLAMIRCLAHEMIHLNQWLTGKMEDINGQRWRVRWGQRVYRSELAYRKHPWEIEAHRHEAKLAQSFIDFWTSGWRK